jgi:putative ABC transport system permease protein
MPLSFVWSALLTAGFSVVVDVAMFGKLKRIGMADNLKSVD